MQIFECRPVALFWDKVIKGGTCIDENHSFRWDGVANIILDFLVWSLTLPVIWRLQCNIRQKLSVTAVFFLAILWVPSLAYDFVVAERIFSACSVSIVRIVSFNGVNLRDVTYAIVTPNTWTTIEQMMSIICAYLPATGPLLDRCLSKTKYGPSAGTDHSSATRSGAVTLSNYPWIPFVRLSTDSMTAGFAQLDEQNGFQPAQSLLLRP